MMLGSFGLLICAQESLSIATVLAKAFPQWTGQDVKEVASKLRGYSDQGVSLNHGEVIVVDGVIFLTECPMCAMQSPSTSTLL